MFCGISEFADKISEICIRSRSGQALSRPVKIKSLIERQHPMGIQPANVRSIFL